jgi:hypothetical protein
LPTCQRGRTLGVHKCQRSVVSLGVLADRLVGAVADPNCLAQHRAVAALAEIGADRLPSLAAERLHRLAAQDERLIKCGAVQHIICDDEGLRTAIRQLLAPPTGASSDYTVSVTC